MECVENILLFMQPYPAIPRLAHLNSIFPNILKLISHWQQHLL